MKRLSSLPRSKQWLLGFLVIFMLATVMMSLKPRAPVPTFTKLAKPVTPGISADGKVEVISFFMYHCQFCYQSENEINAWVKGKGGAIDFKRIAMPYKRDNDPEARLYLTLEAMGLEEKFHGLIMKTIHADGNRFHLDEDHILKWISQQEIDQQRFLSTWHSQVILDQLRNLQDLVTSYEVTGTPSLVVGGHFLTSPSAVTQASTDTKLVTLSQILDELVLLVPKTH